MDINFHYFAVKVLACKAGFSEEQAQLIASYSQFVDDYDSFNVIKLENVPYFAQYLATKIPNTNNYLFNPVTTGFSSWFDMALLVLEKNQKWVATPFHFIPQKTIPLLNSRIELRVQPAKLDKPSLIQSLILDAKKSFIDNKTKGSKTNINLMQIGILLHTFADTYAHQGFSGYQGWENHSFLKKVINNIDGKDITSNYSPQIYCYLPSIGHANVNHAPDDSNVSFMMYQKVSESDTKYSVIYERDNTSEFCITAKEILNYMRSCLDLLPISDNEWNILESSLRKGFLTIEKKVPNLIKHWNKWFPEIRFYYDLNECYNVWFDVCKDQLNTSQASQSEDAYETLYIVKSDMFYHYNVLCDKIRKAVNSTGLQNTNWLNSIDNLSEKEKEMKSLFESEDR